MIKARGRSATGRDTVFLGLSYGNLERFRKQPMDTFIRIEAAELELPFDILIFSGRTEAEMSDWMLRALGPEAHITLSERSKN